GRGDGRRGLRSARPDAPRHVRRRQCHRQGSAWHRFRRHRLRLRHPHGAREEGRAGRGRGAEPGDRHQRHLSHLPQALHVHRRRTHGHRCAVPRVRSFPRGAGPRREGGLLSPPPDRPMKRMAAMETGRAPVARTEATPAALSSSDARLRRRKAVDKAARWVIAAIASTAIAAVALIFVFLLREALPIFTSSTVHEEVTLGKMLFAQEWRTGEPPYHAWQPVSKVPKYSLLPLLVGTFKVAI